MILFEEVGLNLGSASLRGNRRLIHPKREEARRVSRLESELLETRSFLRSFQEEHQAAQQELQSVNEELQSINDELETSKHELESSNEGLNTINKAIANANAELKQAERALVLLDLKLPGISGLEVLDWMRSKSNVSTLSTLMFTSSNQERDIRRALRARSQGLSAKTKPSKRSVYRSQSH